MQLRDIFDLDLHNLAVWQEAGLEALARQIAVLLGIDREEHTSHKAAMHLATAASLAHESERKLQTLVDCLPVLAWTAEADGWMSWYNRRWYEYTGTTRQQMEGWGWTSVHDSRMLPAVLDSWTRSIRTGLSFEMIFPLREADGQSGLS